jgi:hypothetical protein
MAMLAGTRTAAVACVAAIVSTGCGGAADTSSDSTFTDEPLTDEAFADDTLDDPFTDDPFTDDTFGDPFTDDSFADETFDEVAGEPPSEPDPTGAASPTDEGEDGAIAADAAARGVPVDEILEELRENGFCDPDDVSGTDDVGTVTAMHFVVDAVPQAPCAGAGDDRLDAAWEQLAAIAPHEYVADISLLAGYEACEGCATLAFVTTLDEQGTFFLMAIDVTAAQDDPDELLLTLVHELAHVVTQDPETELDPTVDAEDCPTYHNGNGCLTDTAYTWAWIQEFWDPADIAAIDAGEADEAAGEERCAVSAAYTGAYGASSPEEDLAEVFSAYVFDVALDPALDAKLHFFDRRPEFRRIRERAEALGRTGLPGNFEGCG